MSKKLKIAWHTFTCCEDSTILFTELMNEHFFEWKKLLEFKHAKFIQKNNEIKDIDVAFLEGAISSKKEEDLAKEFRENSKRVVAIGSCAVSGMPSAQRNNFDEKTKEEIKPDIERYHLNEKVVPLKAVIKVDDEVPGCPMLESKFLEVLEKYLKEFGVK